MSVRGVITKGTVVEEEPAIELSVAVMQTLEGFDAEVSVAFDCLSTTADVSTTAVTE